MAGERGAAADGANAPLPIERPEAPVRPARPGLLRRKAPSGDAAGVEVLGGCEIQPALRVTPTPNPPDQVRGKLGGGERAAGA